MRKLLFSLPCAMLFTFLSPQLALAQSYTAAVQSLSSQSVTSGSTLGINGVVTSTAASSVIVQYNIREIYNGNSTNIIVNSPVLTLPANQSVPVDLNAYIPPSVPAGTYRIDILIYASDWSSTLLYVDSATTFQVAAPTVATYSVTGTSVAPATANPGATISISGTAASNVTGNVIVQYNIREVNNANSTNIAVNSPAFSLQANEPAPVNLSTTLPSDIPAATYRIDAYIYSSDWANKLLYSYSVATFQVAGNATTTTVTPTYSVTGASVTPTFVSPGASIAISGTASSNTTQSVIVQYNIREINNANSVNITVNSPTFNLQANVPAPVNLSTTLPTNIPAGTYRIDALIFKSDWSATLYYLYSATTFSVQSGTTRTLPFLIGVYEGAQNPTGIANYEAWLGRKMDRILDTIPSASWSNMVTDGWNWFASQWKGNESRLIVTIPMLPTMNDYSGPSMDDATASANLASGASGAFDSYWVQMRQDLINSGYGNSMIRLGWEMNGSWYNWRASVNPTAWVSYFQRIVTILRNDPNAHFKINFNPTLGYQAIPADQVYPGDAYVDAIGLDVYDEDWNGYYPISASATPAQALSLQQQVWSHDILNDPHGLIFWSNFAKTHGKQFTIPEWGVVQSVNHGGGDDTYFIQSMYNFASNPSNGVTILTYFDMPGLYGTASNPTLFPNSANLFKQLFGP